MQEWPPFVPYLILAFICCVASVAIAAAAMFFVFGHGGTYISNTGLIAIAGMTFAPAIMGIGIASFMSHDQH